jgi:hypothetical protein
MGPVPITIMRIEKILFIFEMTDSICEIKQQGQIVPEPIQGAAVPENL